MDEAEKEEFNEMFSIKEDDDLSNCSVRIMAGTWEDYSMWGGGMVFEPTGEYAMYIEVPFAVIDTIYAPTLSLESGEVTVNTDLWITADLATDTIYYSVDEKEFQKAEEIHTVTLVLDRAMKVSAYAIGKDGRKSSTVSAAYTLAAEPEFSIVRKSEKVGEATVGEAETIYFTVKEKEESANEAGELAGVNIYPNPTAGAFNVAVPERARIDIFGLNGAKVQSREVNAGVEAFNLDHSGIYFVRVMAGNKTAVKRVVVR